MSADSSIPPAPEAGRPAVGAPARSGSPNSWLAPAVIATLCFFPPTGIVAVYFSAQVGPRWTSGDRRAAMRCARRARTWVLISLVLWVLATAILVATGRAGRLLEAGVL